MSSRVTCRPRAWQLPFFGLLGLMIFVLAGCRECPEIKPQKKNVTPPGR